MDRRRAWALLAAALAFALAGCGGDESEPAAEPVAPTDSCEDPLAEVLPDGSCLRAGILPQGCAAGFEHDGAYGCVPLLPAERCGAGLMATPGEMDCRPVMPCGQPPWGSIDLGSATQFVDAAFQGASDGSQSGPWTTIGAAVAAATPGAVIAIAPGSYAEGVVLNNKSVRLRGLCPDQVSIVAPAGGSGQCPAAAVCIVGSGASGSEVSGISLTGAGLGVIMSGTADVLVDRVRAHDNGNWGIDLEATLGRSSMTLRGSLIESNLGAGVVVLGSNAVIEDSVVRTNLPQPDQTAGRGIAVQQANAERSSATVRNTVIDGNHEVGLRVTGSDLVLESSVVRATQPAANDATTGWGISANSVCAETADALVCDPALRANLTLSTTVVEYNHETGVLLRGSAATLDNMVVRNTLPRPADGLFGRGIDIASSCIETTLGTLRCDPTARSSLVVNRMLVDGNHDFGVNLMGSDATLDGAVIRGTLPRSSDGLFGHGVGASVVCNTALQCDPMTPSAFTVRGSLVEQNFEVGIVVIGSTATLEASVIRQTAAGAGGFLGDGISVLSDGFPTNVTLNLMRVDDNERAGISSFGSSLALGATHVACAAFELAGEQDHGLDFNFDDRGGNLCGCPQPDGACKAVSVGLQPPKAPGIE